MILPERIPRPASHQRFAALAMSFPETSSGDNVRAAALALRRRCSACGCNLTGNVYNVWTESPDEERAPWVIWRNNIYISGRPGPMHKSCALWAALQQCPFLRHPTSRRKLSNPGARRGDAALVGFARHGFGFNDPQDPDWVFTWVDVTESISYVASRDLLPVYAEAVATDAKLIDIQSRLYWTDSAMDSHLLRECKRVDDARLTMMRRGGLKVSADENYRLALL
ncbi:hypothetical protein [Mycobacterium sp. 1165178.9]|uniref:hypothetical protein n=1 Tax=Mycobacterium sp. 1165178.9 TaxID=1834070 RepID=UPI0012EA675F|nr:hypothetical protein [Mycobacterium sp. 1165178.9]